MPVPAWNLSHSSVLFWFSCSKWTLNCKRLLTNSWFLFWSLNQAMTCIWCWNLILCRQRQHICLESKIYYKLSYGRSWSNAEILVQLLFFSALHRVQTCRMMRGDRALLLPQRKMCCLSRTPMENITMQHIHSLNLSLSQKILILYFLKLYLSKVISSM